MRYRDPGGEQRTKTFGRRIDAERYLTTIESSELSRGAEPGTVRKIDRVLSLILALAFRDSRLLRNPATDIKLPRPQSLERRYLTHGQAHELALRSPATAEPSMQA